MPTLSNYGNICHKFYVCIVRSRKERVDFIHIWYSNQPQQGLDAYQIYLGCAKMYLCPLFHSCWMFILEMNPQILFIFATGINQHIGFVHIKYSLALCQNRMLMPSVCFDISLLNSRMLFIFGIVSICHKGLMYVGCKLTMSKQGNLSHFCSKISFARNPH